MLNIGSSEFFLLGVLFLLLFGPEKLPEMARAFGKAYAAFRQHSQAISQEMRRQLEHETETLAQIRTQAKELNLKAEIDILQAASKPITQVPFNVEPEAQSLGDGSHIAEPQVVESPTTEHVAEPPAAAPSKENPAQVPA